jgi:hypothetical protein
MTTYRHVAVNRQLPSAFGALRRNTAETEMTETKSPFGGVGPRLDFGTFPALMAGTRERCLALNEYERIDF